MFGFRKRNVDSDERIDKLYRQLETSEQEKKRLSRELSDLRALTSKDAELENESEELSEYQLAMDIKNAALALRFQVDDFHVYIRPDAYGSRLIADYHEVINALTSIRLTAARLARMLAKFLK